MTKISGSGGDIAAQDVVGYDVKAEAGAKPYVNILVDGTLDDNFAWKRGWEKQQATPVIKAAIECMDLLKEAITVAEANGNTGLATSLKSQLTMVKQGLQDIKVAGEQGGVFNNQIGPASIPIVALGKTIEYVSKSGVAEKAMQSSSSVVGNDTNSGQTKSSSAALTSATGSETKSSEMDEGQKADFAEHVVTISQMDLAAEFADDPKGMWDKLSQLGGEERQFALMKLQSGTQENNQLFSTLTNFMKAMHDTEKAVISNLRV